MRLLSDKAQLRLIRSRTRFRRMLRASTRRLRAAAGRLFARGGAGPDEPYALVTARVRPRLPHKSGGVAVDPYEF